MTDKELRRMSRGELLEMLIIQMDENEALRKQLAQEENELKNRRIIVDEAGSLAEAALRLNGIFEATDQTAQQYLENVCFMAGEKPKDDWTYEEKNREGNNAL